MTPQGCRLRSELDWNYETEPGAKLEHPMYLCRGKTLGGSTCANVMLYQRGEPNQRKTHAAVALARGEALGVWGVVLWGAEGGRRLAWPLRKDDAEIRKSDNI